jgi:hypothetical protein
LYIRAFRQPFLHVFAIHTLYNRYIYTYHRARYLRNRTWLNAIGADRPFLNGKGAPLASLVFSAPGGVANFLEKGAPGLNTTAEQVRDEWVINGEKVRLLFIGALK